MAGRYVVVCTSRVKVGDYDVIDQLDLGYVSGSDFDRDTVEAGLTVSKSEAIKMIKEGTDIYVMDRKAGYPRSDRPLVIAVSDKGNEYLTSAADTTGTNDLDGVPDCSSKNS
jgi:hypothetical protein